MNFKNKQMEKIAVKFTGLMIRRIEDVSTNRGKPWLEVKRENYQPRNLSGRYYSGGNSLMLLFNAMSSDFRTPVFLTFLQAKNLGVRIHKGAVSFPVFHIGHVYYEYVTGEKITETEYEMKSDTAKADFREVAIPCCYDVFNLDQTTYAEKYPEEWGALLDAHQTLPDTTSITTKEQYVNSLLDKHIETQNWVCPIDIHASNQAYYSPSEDRIVLPLKEQFPCGKEFYAAALHEMAHSTGHKDRLNRISPMQYSQRDAYAREELVAELSSALSGYYLGIETAPRDENAAYLKHWLNAMRKDTAFLMDVLKDVMQAVNCIFKHLDSDLTLNGKPGARKTRETIPAGQNDGLLVVG